MFTYLTKNQWCTGKLLIALLMHSYFIKNNAIVLYYRIWCLQDLGILSPLFDNFGSNTNCLIWKEDWRILVQNKLARVWKCCFSLQILTELIAFWWISILWSVEIFFYFKPNFNKCAIFFILWDLFLSLLKLIWESLNLILRVSLQPHKCVSNQLCPCVYVSKGPENLNVNSYMCCFHHNCYDMRE